MEKTDEEMARKHWLLTEGLEGLLADKWEERAERLRTMAQEAKKAEARVKTKEKRVGEIERMIDTVFKMEGKEEMRVRNELHSMKDETETGRRHVISRKVEIAEALLQWKEEMEAEKRECEEEIAERKAFAKSLERPLENIAELLDSRWLYDVVGDEQK
jgi:spore cortex formation protein SpoVR/YcgB (stage V sporulation)